MISLGEVDTIKLGFTGKKTRESVCVVCVCEREREKEKKGERESES